MEFIRVLQTCFIDTADGDRIKVTAGKVLRADQIAIGCLASILDVKLAEPFDPDAPPSVEPASDQPEEQTSVPAEKAAPKGKGKGKGKGKKAEPIESEATDDDLA